MAERYGKEILEEFPEVDAVLGVGSIHNICEAVDHIAANIGKKRRRNDPDCRYFSHEDKTQSSSEETES